MKKPTKRMRENEVRRRILDWAKSHGWIINPSKGYEGYIDNVFEFGFCPCDRTRATCPCGESETEVEQKGHCLCRLFWKDLDTFKNTLKEEVSEEVVTSENREANRGRAEDRNQL